MRPFNVGILVELFHESLAVLLGLRFSSCPNMLRDLDPIFAELFEAGQEQCVFLFGPISTSFNEGWSLKQLQEVIVLFLGV